MSGDDRYAAALAVAAAARATLAKVEAARGSAFSKRLGEGQALRDDEAALAALVESDNVDEGLRHVDGAEAAPLKPDRAKRRKTLEERIPKRRAAIPLLQQREADASAAVEAAKVPYTAAVLETVAAIQGPATERLVEGLEALRPALVDLIVADRILTSTIGDRFSLPNGAVPPFSGAKVVAKLLAGIVDRVRPANLTESHVEAAAQAEIVPALRTIQHGGRA